MRFYYKKMYGLFTGAKKCGRNNEVAVRRGSTVIINVRRNLKGEFVKTCRKNDQIVNKGLKFLLKY